MTNNLMWYQTSMPLELIELIEKDLSNFDNGLSAARTTTGVSLDIRDSKTSWIDKAHWVSGLCWHYVNVANRENFLYDIDGFENNHLQYTSYSEGEYYHWHVDGDLSNCRPQLEEMNVENKINNFLHNKVEKVRKLSIIVQLSSPEDYSGGEVQIQYSDRSTGFLPKTRGTVAIFDSRCLHRVKPVRSGRRKSIVGWIDGPRWK